MLSVFIQAMEILANACNSTTNIFLITDGSVEDERNICNIVRTHMKSIGSTCPRISTFGIGKNHGDFGLPPSYSMAFPQS